MIKLIGPGRGAGQLELTRLLSAGVLKEERIGHQRMISANTQFILYDELRSICVKTFGVVDVLIEALRPHLDKIEEAFIFGAMAKRTEHSGSDVNLFVIGAVSSLALALGIDGAERAIGRSVHLTVYDTVEWGDVSQHDPVTLSILAGPKIEVIKRGDPGRTNQESR